VRELKNVIERLVILSAADEITPEDLHLPGDGDGSIPSDAPLKEAREEFERRHILAALRRHRGNVSRAAETLQIERSNLYRKLKSYGIEVERE
jgi:two-component system nitrogen regulation response regulator NtrX